MVREALATLPLETDEAATLDDFLARQEQRTLLRFITCGSVDDGKSTLIGRLLADTKAIFEDQLATLERDSRKFGTTGGDVDYALLVDGLQAEREQGITIDVAYRFFSTPKRKFIVADTPGHEQYTRNMATGASTADLAVVLVDARQGILTQTRRHTMIASLLGIRRIALAVNKMDLVGFAEERFRQIEAEYRAFAERLGFLDIQAVPLSARGGDNVVNPSLRTPWYRGPSLLAHLEDVPLEHAEAEQAFRLPVQWVNRPNLDFRGLAGTIASGTVAVGDAVVLAKSGQQSAIRAIYVGDRAAQVATAGQAVTVVLDRDVEAARGTMVVAPDARPHVADRLSADLVWFDEEHLMPGRSCLLRTETDQVPATVTTLRHRIDMATFASEADRTLTMNDIGLADIALQAPVAFDRYCDNRATGSFVLIDRLTNATIAAGMIREPLRRASNVHLQQVDIDRTARAAQKNQAPLVLWFTGLSGSGKSTIANLLDRRLNARGAHTCVLDGDNIRHGLNRDLGFSEKDRVENIRRVAEVAKLMTDAGLIVIVSLISPFSADRQLARSLMSKGEFAEIFVDTPIDECMRRDPKGLYKKARAGEIANFTGIDQPYETPENAEIHLRTEGTTPEGLVDEIERWLAQHAARREEFDHGGGI